MVGAFPKARLILARNGRTGFRDAPTPLAPLIVDNVAAREFPHPHKLVIELLLPAELVRIEQAHQGLGLHPPMLFPVPMIGSRVKFVAQAARGIKALGGSGGHVDGHLPKPVNAVLVAEDFGRFEQQPGGFDVVAKRNGG